MDPPSCRSPNPTHFFLSVHSYGSSGLRRDLASAQSGMLKLCANKQHFHAPDSELKSAPEGCFPRTPQPRRDQPSVASDALRVIFLVTSWGKLKLRFVGGRSGFLGNTGVPSLLPSLTGRRGCGWNKNESSLVHLNVSLYLSHLCHCATAFLEPLTKKFGRPRQ